MTISCPVAVLALDQEGGSPLEELLLRAVERGARLVVVPFGLGGTGAELAALAKRAKVLLAGGWTEEGGQERLNVAALFSAEGALLGRHVQTHYLPGEVGEAGEVGKVSGCGDRIEPIATPLGKLGLSVGSEIYFPEVHWSLAQQGAELLIHLEAARWTHDHFYSVLSPKVRALDVNRPFLIARPTSRRLKLVHNEEMGIAGVPMAGSVVIDQNGAVLASTGFSHGLALADLRLAQHCRSGEAAANVPMRGGNEIWRLYFNDSRKRYFAPLREPVAAVEKPSYAKRKIRVAMVTTFHGTQLGDGNPRLLELVREACAAKPDLVVLTEMESTARPEKRVVAELTAQLVAETKKAGAYLAIGGVRHSCPEFFDEPYGEAVYTSHGVLWNREGREVYRSRIMLYGKGCGQEVYDTDFGRVAIRLCGDVYAPELDRLFALQGVDLVINPSMSWGASGLVNTELNQVRAMDNGHWIVSVHLAFSDAGQRSHVIDPMGGVVAASPFYREGVTVAEIDLDAPRGVFVPDGQREVPEGSYLQSYRSEQTHRLVPQSELLKQRRPELYTGLDADRPDHPYTTRDRGDGVVLFKPASL